MRVCSSAIRVACPAAHPAAVIQRLVSGSVFRVDTRSSGRQDRLHMASQAEKVLGRKDRDAAIRLQASRTVATP